MGPSQRRVTGIPRAIVVCAALIFGAAACDDGSPTGPRVGYVMASVQVSGGDPDDGFEIGADSIKVSVLPNSSSVFHVAEGVHVIELTGVAANCIVNGANPVSVSVPNEDTAYVDFQVGCAPTGVSVETRTTGSDLPISVEISIPPVIAPMAVSANSVHLITRLAPGRYNVKVRVGSANCVTAGDSIVTVDVINRQVASASFDILCTGLPLNGAIAFVDKSELFLMNADGTDIAFLNSGWFPEWSRDGSKIVYSDTRCDFYTYVCTGSLAIVVPATRQITLLSQATAGLYPSWSPTDDVIAYVDGNTNLLHLLDIATMTTTKILLGASVTAYSPSWSPDGTQLVAVCQTPGPGTQICIFNRDGTNLRYVTEVGYYERPDWSPDGRRIVFARYVTGGGAITVINPDGTGLRTLTTGTSPAWSPDGAQIVFSANRGLFVLNENGSGMRRLTTGDHYFATWRR